MKIKAHLEKELEAERQLLPRLKFMGYVLVFCCLAAFGFAIAVEDTSGLEEDSLQHQTSNRFGLETLEEEIGDPAATDILNFYMVSSVFASVATICFIIVWKRKKLLLKKHSSSNN